MGSLAAGLFLCLPSCSVTSLDAPCIGQNSFIINYVYGLCWACINYDSPLKCNFRLNNSLKISFCLTAHMLLLWDVKLCQCWAIPDISSHSTGFWSTIFLDCLTVKMKAVWSSETSSKLQFTQWQNITSQKKRIHSNAAVKTQLNSSVFTKTKW